MRFNAVIAAYILAATVTGAALPITDATAEAIAAPEAAPAEADAPDGGEFAFSDDDFEIEFDDFEKRSADPSADPDAEAGWTW